MSDLDDKRRRLAESFAEADALAAPLDARLALYEARSRAVVPDVMAAYDRMVARLESGETGRSGVPRVGDELEAFVLPGPDGRLVSLADALTDGAALVSINRGHWCPYCRLELRALARAHRHLSGRGAQIVSIVPETEAFVAKLRQEHGLPFPVLTDIDLAYALSLGLLVWVGEEMIALYSAMGIDLPRFHGTGKWFLPIPATFVVGQDRRIRAAYVNPDFRRRMTLEQIEAALGA